MGSKHVKPRFSQTSEPESLPKTKTIGKGGGVHRLQRMRGFFDTPGSSGASDRGGSTIGVSVHHFKNARSLCTWHCGRLQEPCSWESRQTWGLTVLLWGGASQGFQTTKTEAPVNHWLRLVRNKNYFTSSDPHHDISRHIVGHIF